MESYKVAVCGPLGSGKTWMASMFMNGYLLDTWPRDEWRTVILIDDKRSQ